MTRPPARCALLAVVLSALLPCGAGAAPVKWREALHQPAPWYASAEARALAATVRLYQFANGGWPKNREMTLAPAAEAAARPAPVPHDEQMPTIDNGATHTQLRFLARVITAGAGTDADRAAVARGLDYLLAAQYANGGWPQFFPVRPGYYAHITFNDDAMVNVLEVLDDVAQGRAPFAFVAPAFRPRAASAVARGLDCILRCQVIVDGGKTAWCAQHDETTFAPAPARKFEPVSLSGGESVELVRFLMSQEEPSPAVVEAVEAAIAWFRAVQLNGIRYQRVAVPGSARGYDWVVRPDPAAPPLWARFYELGTNRPIFLGRDSVVHYAVGEIEYERRIGYRWYVDTPARLLAKDYPAWKTRREAFTIANAERAVRPAHPGIRRLEDRVPAGVSAHENLAYAAVAGQELQLDLYQPAGAGPHPAVLLVHGGGWERGSRQMERPFAQRLAGLGYVAIPVSYRLGAEGRFPGALHDLKAAVRWVRTHAADHAIDPDRIAVVGMSAGGQLAALMGTTNDRAEFEGEVGGRAGSSRVQAVVDIDGVVDFTAADLVAQQEKQPTSPARFLGGKFSERPDTWRQASALTHAGPRSAPTLFINSTARLPILPGREAMRDQLRAAGVSSDLVVIPDTPHPFWLFHPWFEPTLAAADQFLREQMPGAKRPNL